MRLRIESYFRLQVIFLASILNTNFPQRPSYITVIVILPSPFLLVMSESCFSSFWLQVSFLCESSQAFWAAKFPLSWIARLSGNVHRRATLRTRLLESWLGLYLLSDNQESGRRQCQLVPQGHWTWLKEADKLKALGNQHHWLGIVKSVWTRSLGLGMTMITMILDTSLQASQALLTALTLTLLTLEATPLSLPCKLSCPQLGPQVHGLIRRLRLLGFANSKFIGCDKHSSHSFKCQIPNRQWCLNNIKTILQKYTTEIFPSKIKTSWKVNNISPLKKCKAFKQN